MKTKLVLLGICITLLMVSCGEERGLESGQYNFSADVIYQQEGYTPSYAYQFFRTINYGTGYTIFACYVTSAESSITMLNTDREFEEIVFQTQKEMDKDRLKTLKELFADEKELVAEIEENVEYINWLEYEGTIYALVYYDMKEVKEFQYYLLRYASPEDKSYVGFTLEYARALEIKVTERLAVYEDHTICVEDKLWFDENLKQIDKEEIDYNSYIVSEKELQEYLLATGNNELETLGKDIGYVGYGGRIGDMYYCFFSVKSQWTEEDIYLAEIDVDGNLLSVAKIQGVGFLFVDEIIPKAIGEDGEYYDVLR